MGAAVGALGAAFSVFSQLKAQKAQKRAMQQQQKAQEVADARERRKLLRSSAIARGQTINTAASIGGLGSSGLTGGLMGLQNQAQSQLGFQQTTLDISKAITNQNIAANKFMTMASFGEALSGFGKS